MPAQRRSAGDDSPTDPFPVPFIPAQRRESPDLASVRAALADPALVRGLAARPHRRGALTVSILVGLALVVGVLVAAVAVPAARQTATEAFLTELHSTPGWTAGPDTALAQGRGVCDRVAAGASQADLVAGAGGGVLGAALVDAARTHLCP